MSTWKDFVTAALLGTEKGMEPKLPSPLAQVFDASAGLDREQRFLTHAGAFGLWRITGAKFGANDGEIVPVETEELPLINGTAASHLRAMLGGTNNELLPEWLEAVTRLKKRVSPELVPALLEHALKEASIRNVVISAGGHRANWLASHNPRWSFASNEDQELWETGTRDQRTAILRGLRAASPGDARVKIETVWKEEPADVRLAFVKQLATNLSDEDIPFLEAALDDRSKEVRREAIELLSRLPSSPFVTRMTDRAKPLLTFKKGKLLSRASIEVNLPGTPDAAALRDGVNPKDFGNQKDLGEKAVALLLIIAAVPLKHWTYTFEQNPEALLKALGKSEFASAVVTGWAMAAVRQQNSEWAEVLIAGETELNPNVVHPRSLFAVLPETSRVERIRAALRTSTSSGEAEPWHVLQDQLRTLSGQWPVALARDVLAALRKAYDSNTVPWQLHGVLQSLPSALPPSLLPEAVTGWPEDKYGISALVETLTFRQAALSALS